MMDADVSSDDDLSFTINKKYAKQYDIWRQKEELSKLKQKYGDVSSSDESSSEEEDENAEGLTAQQEKDWLRTLAALKSKDPKIYDKDFTFYLNEDDNSGESTAKKRKKEKKPKPMTLKDYERKVALEKGGILSESGTDTDSDEERRTQPGYYEEQEEIRKSFREAVESNSDEEDLLQKRKKSKEELEKEENEYHEWLKGQKAELAEEAAIELVPLKEYWNDPGLATSEKYLRDFILNKRYLDEDDDEIPTYEEIVNEEHLSEDEKEIEKQEDFERKYNFRFEQPDQEFIKSYPRTIQETVRKKENKRAQKRQEAKERKQKTKEQKAQDLKRLKNLKKMEIMEKLETLREITGNPNVGFSEKDLEGDFDPAQYDAMMKKAFDEEYYDMEEDDAKPEWADAEQFGIEDEDWDNWQDVGASATTGEDQKQGSYEEPHCEDPHFNMDADYDPSMDNRSHGLDGTSKKKKRKKSKFSQALERKKPKFDPEEKTFEEYLDEYYKLDFEDIIGDMPCRFKYRKVVPNTFGLNADEILAAEDKHLNAWVSLKKMSQYRTEEEEMMDIRKYKAKAGNVQRKLNVIPSLQESWAKEGTQITSKKKKKKKKQKPTSNEEVPKTEKGHKRMHDSVNDAEVEREESDEQGTSLTEEKAVLNSDAICKTAKPQKAKNKKKKQKLSDESPKAYGINAKKFEYSQPSNLETDNTESKNSKDKSGNVVSEGGEQRKKQKKRNSNPAESSTESTLDSKNEVKHVDISEEKKTKVKKMKKKNKRLNLSDDRLKAYGINPKKFKYTQHAKEKT